MIYLKHILFEATDSKPINRLTTVHPYIDNQIILFESNKQDLVSKKFTNHIFNNYIKGFKKELYQSSVNPKDFLSEEEIDDNNIGKIKISLRFIHYEKRFEGSISHGSSGIDISLHLSIPEKEKTTTEYEEIYHKLYSLIRHELEHVKQLAAGEKLNSNPEYGKPKIKNVPKRIQKNFYYLTDPIELEAYGVEIFRSAKKRGETFSKYFEKATDKIASDMGIDDYPELKKAWVSQLLELIGNRFRITPSQ
jgi:hypothetical protein